jgi:hypothetical protein
MKPPVCELCGWRRVTKKVNLPVCNYCLEIDRKKLAKMGIKVVIEEVLSAGY